MSLTSSLNLSAFGVPRIENTRPRFPHHDLRPRRALRRSSVQRMSGADYNRSPKTLRATVFTQTDPMPMGAGSAYESSYVYAGDNPNIYSDPSGLRKTKCNTSLGRQAGASFLGLASTFVPFYNRDFSQCEAQAVSKILTPATVVGSTLAAGSCGTLVGIGTLNPQMAAGAAGACGGVASGVAGGNLNLPDVSWGFAEGYSTAPPGNVPFVAASGRAKPVRFVLVRTV